MGGQNNLFHLSCQKISIFLNKIFYTLLLKYSQKLLNFKKKGGNNLLYIHNTIIIYFSIYNFTEKFVLYY